MSDKSATWLPFTTQVKPKTIACFRSLASDDGRELHQVLDDALNEYIQAHSSASRRRIMAALSQSMAEHDSLYSELSK